MSIALRALAALGLVACGFAVTTPPASAGCSGGLGDQQGSTCEDKLSWSYNPDARRFEYGNQIVPNKNKKDDYEYAVRYACDGNEAGETDHECKTARDCDPLTDVDGTQLFGRKVAVDRRPTDGSGAWEQAGTGCQYAGKTVPMDDVVAAVQRQLEKEVGHPTITAQPPNRVTLVNFVSLFHAPAQQVTSLSIDAPVPGTLSGSPEYKWNLDDGIVQSGTGHAYDGSVDPRADSSDGYYVKAKYATKGRKEITLTLTWRVTMSLGTTTVALDPIVFTATDYTDAKEKRAVLVND